MPNINGNIQNGCYSPEGKLKFDNKRKNSDKLKLTQFADFVSFF
jgi:hypothetical protein